MGRNRWTKREKSILETYISMILKKKLIIRNNQKLPET